MQILRGFRRARKKSRKRLHRWRTVAIAALIPTLSREQMVADAKQNGRFHLVEESYEAQLPSGELTTVTEFSVVTVPEVLLVGSYGLPVTLNGRVLREPVSSSRGHLYLPALAQTVSEVGLWTLLKLVWSPTRSKMLRSAPSIASGVHVITRASPRAGGSQYAHWFLEHAPQIAAVEQARPSLPQPFAYLTNAEVQEFQTEVFEAFDVPRADVHPHDGRFLHVRNLIVATLRNGHSRGSEYDPKAHLRVRERLTRQGVEPEGCRPASEFRPWLVAVLRPGARTRRAANLAEARSLVGRFDGHLLPEEAKLAEQLQLLRECEVMVGIYGAGLVKMLLCPALRVVVEVVPPRGEPRDIYERLAKGLGIDYRRVFGKEPAPSRSGASAHGDVIVPVDEVEAILCAARQRSRAGD